MRGRIGVAAVALWILTAGQVHAAEPAWGIGARIGDFGVPNWILDEFLDEHPTVKGNLYGGEIRYYGDGGTKGALSLGLTFDYGTASANGTWRKDPEDEAVTAEGSIRMLAVTLTGYWDMFASWPVHPFIGFGLGYARMQGSYEEDGATVRIEENLPAVHLPLGLVVRLGRHATLRAEARIINSISFGGHLMMDF